jgi:hypothetical protein
MKFLRWRYWFPAVLVLITILHIADQARSSASAPLAKSTATVTTDRRDYFPGETAYITGAGFAPWETVELQVLHVDGRPNTGDEHHVWRITADVIGGFQTTWHVCEDDCIGSWLRLTATGLNSGLKASAVFSDALGTVFLETMGTAAPGASPFPTIEEYEASNSFDNVALTMTGNGTMRSTSPSTNFYAGSSGGANVFLTDVDADKFFQIEGINTTALGDLQLSFGIFKNTTLGDGSDLVVDISTNGVDYTELMYDALPTGAGTEFQWYFRTASDSIPEASNLRIRFSNTGELLTQYRIDDVRLEAAQVVVAADNAADGAYADGWATGDNGGFGFMPWAINDGGGGHFVASSTNNCADGLQGSGIDTDGVSWGLFHGVGDAAEAVRPFIAPMVVGQTFAIDMDNGFIDSGTVGFGLQTLDGGTVATNRVEVFFIGGGLNYTLQHGATSTDSTLGFTCDGLRIEVTLETLDRATVTLRPRTGSAVTFTNIALGGVAGTRINQVRLFEANGMADTAHDTFFNSIILTCADNPTTEASNNGPICEGATLSLMATGEVADAYIWTGPDGFSSTEQNPEIVGATTAASGIYEVLRIVDACTSLVARTTAIVSELPSTEASNNGPLCEGDTLELSATGDSGTFSWTGPNGFTSTEQNPSISNVQLSAAGDYCVTRTVNGCDSEESCTTVVVNAKPTVSAGNNGPICAGQTLQLTAMGDSGTFSWTGPNSFSSSDQNPMIIDAQTTDAGDYCVTVTDANGCTSDESCTTVTILPSPAVSPETLPAGGAGFPYSQTISASGGTPPVTLAITAGALPDGLSFDGARIFGIPTTLGDFPFTITATDDNGCMGSREYTITILFLGCPPISIFPAVLPAAQQDVAYTQTLSTSAGIGPFTFIRTAGSYPPGIAMSVDGVISGTATARGTFTFKVQVIDSEDCVGERFYTLTVGCPAIGLAPSTLPLGQVDAAYSVDITAVAGTAPFTFAQSAGSLPAGLSLSNIPPATVRLSGTPTSGSSIFTITATDANGCQGSQVYTLVLAIAPPSLPAALRPMALGVPYTEKIAASGGEAPYRYAVTGGALPPGVALAGTGDFSGAPAAMGEFSFTVTVTDAGNRTGSRTYDVTVACPTINTGPSSLPAATLGQPYNQPITATGGSSPHGFAVTGGSLPAGLTLSGAGVVTGTATEPGEFNFTVTVTDARGCAASRQHTIQVGCPAMTVAPSALASGTAGQTYSQTIVVSGGTAPHGFAVTTGSLPSGLMLSAAGELSGTPTADGNFSLTVTVTDARGCAVSRAFTIRVGNPAEDQIFTGRVVTVTDSDGDRVTLKVLGPGMLAVNVSGAGGARIKQVTVTGTDATSILNINVSRGPAGNGTVDIGSIAAAGAMNKINAASANLVGAGINLGGHVGVLKIRDVLNGANILAGGATTQFTTISARTIGDGTTIRLSSSMQKLKVAGAITGATVIVDGNINKVRAAQMADSMLFAGYTPADAADPMAGGPFVPGAQIKSVNIQGANPAFVRSVIAAARIGTVTLGSVAANNGGSPFGVLANESIGSVSVGRPRFQWSRSGGPDQSVGDFHVMR